MVSAHGKQCLRANPSGTALNDFTHYYDDRAGFYSSTPFQLDMSDADAAAIIKKLTGVDLGAGQCPVTAAGLLPAIDLGVQGVLNPTVSKGQANRIVSCSAEATQRDILLARIKKSIEVHESSDKDCSVRQASDGNRTSCPAHTWNPERVPASYGWTQFVLQTITGEIDDRWSSYRAAMAELGITKSMLDAARARATATTQWLDSRRNGLIGLLAHRSADRADIDARWQQPMQCKIGQQIITTSEGDCFRRQTGLGKSDYERMVVWANASIKLGIVRTTYYQSCRGKRTPRGQKVSADGLCAMAAYQKADPAGYAALSALAGRMGTSLTASNDLFPYVRTKMNAEAINSFLNAAMFTDVIFENKFMPVFQSKDLYDKVSDVWLSKRLDQAFVKTRLGANANLSSKDEVNLAEWVWSFHNAGPFTKSKVSSYITKVEPIFQKAFCLTGEGGDIGKLPGYLKMPTLDIDHKN